jgi:hypothetical protein
MTRIPLRFARQHPRKDPPPGVTPLLAAPGGEGGTELKIVCRAQRQRTIFRDFEVCVMETVFTIDCGTRTFEAPLETKIATWMAAQGDQDIRPSRGHASHRPSRPGKYADSISSVTGSRPAMLFGGSAFLYKRKRHFGRGAVHNLGCPANPIPAIRSAPSPR